MANENPTPNEPPNTFSTEHLKFEFEPLFVIRDSNLVIYLFALFRLYGQHRPTLGTLKLIFRAARYALHGCGSPNLEQSKIGQPISEGSCPGEQEPSIFLRRMIIDMRREQG